MESISKKRRRLSLDEFDNCFGDLTTLPDFKGPKVPTNRQTTRMFLHYFKERGDKDDAAQITISKVLQQHEPNPEAKIQSWQLETKLKAQYDNLK